MSFDYTEHARKIIRDAIVSSIYVDDKIAEPFSSIADTEDQYQTLSKELYDSFRSECKTLDFYRFRRDRDWQQDKDYLFKNRDLMILDWQLNDATGIQQENTLRILRRAVATDSLHFVAVYTTTESSRFNTIFYSIKAYFARAYSDKTMVQYGELIESMDGQGVENNFLEPFAGDFISLSLASEKDKDHQLEKIKKRIKDRLGKDYDFFLSELNKIDSQNSIALENIGFCLQKELFSGADAGKVQIRTDFTDSKIIVINHTIIQLINKRDLSPGQLFSFFTDAIQTISGNLLTLISLEIRNLLRESSGFIGKDADGIADEALFYQKQQKENFLDFLMSIIRNHTSSYFDYKQSNIHSATEAFWEGYALKKELPDKIKQLLSKKDLYHKELGKLNIYYNELHIKKGPIDIIRFGDIFYCAEAGSKYVLCITAHCDCLRPEKIRNNFYFIEGEKLSIANALKEKDGGYLSYIRQDDEPVAIKWIQRPIVLKIPDSKISHARGWDGLGREYRLSYITTLKESYAQRMANNSFGFAMRVGIDFVAP